APIRMTPSPRIDSAAASVKGWLVMDEQQIEKLVQSMAERARAAAHQLARVTTAQKNRALLTLADLLEKEAPALLSENEKDLAAGREAGLSDAMLDRLLITSDRLAKIASGVRQVAELPDPVGEVIETVERPNGLLIEKVRTPIGVIGIIYESRPNVTIDCAVLCLKSGNASLLRGGKEAFHTNTAFAALITAALKEASLPANAVQLIPTTERYALNCLLRQDKSVHCIIPRGGEGLIRFVAENSLIP